MYLCWTKAAAEVHKYVPKDIKYQEQQKNNPILPLAPIVLEQNKAVPDFCLTLDKQMTRFFSTSGVFWFVLAFLFLM